MLERFAAQVVRLRWLVLLLVVVLTAALLSQVRNLRIVVDPNTMLPQQHPYVVGTQLAEQVFGTNYMLVIAVAPREGTVYEPDVVERVRRICDGLLAIPEVRKHTLMALTATRAKSIAGNAEGLEVAPLVPDGVPDSAAAALTRQRVEANPIYRDLVVSRDGRVASITVGVDKPRAGFRSTLEAVEKVVSPQRSASVEVAISGVPMFIAQIEKYAQRMVVLFMVAVLVVGLLHYEAFRTVQGLVLPLVTAILSVLWGLGAMGLAGVPMDAFNSTTPILILAVTAGHSVQVLKRYYEEYESSGDPDRRTASRTAIVRTMGRVGPVMLAAGGVAIAGLVSLAGFEVATIRTFGVFTGLGIAAGLVLELTLIPALRAILPPPKARTGGTRFDVWTPIVQALTRATAGPRRRWIYALATLALVPLGFSATQIDSENSYKRYFAPDLPFQRDDTLINTRLAGSNTLYVTFDGGHADAVKDPRFLQLLQRVQDFIAQRPNVGKVVSIVDLLSRMNQALHGEDPRRAALPASTEEASQYLLLYSMSGEPTDFDRYVDPQYRYASITAFLRSDSSLDAEHMVDDIRRMLRDEDLGGIRVEFGGSVLQSTALAEVLVAGKLKNIAQICLVVFLVSCLVFRSLWGGVLVVLPLALTAAANFGLMGLLNIPLNTPNAISAAMAIGVGADYAIYLLYRIREERSRGVDLPAAVAAALASAGRGSLYVGTAIAGGYAVLMLSVGFYVHIWFGLLIVCSMVISVAASLLLIPSLVLDLRPAFVDRSVHKPRLAAGGATASLLLLAAALTLGAPDARAAESTPEQVMEKSYQASRFDTSASEATFRLIAKDGAERTRKTAGYTATQGNGTDNSRYTRFTAPADIRNTATLLIERAGAEDDIWIYLPALKKTRRLSASNKKDAFVGTDFSYGDVIGHRTADWKHRLVKAGDADKGEPWVIESVPANEAVARQSGYSSRISRINPSNFVTEHCEFNDLQGQRLKTMTLDKVVAPPNGRGRHQPLRMQMANHQTGHTTVIEYSLFDANVPVAPAQFTVKALEKEQ